MRIGALAGGALIAGLVLGPVARNLYAAQGGQTAVPFLTFPGEAREAAMGEAYSAEAKGSHAVWANPAGMVRSSERSLTLMDTLYLENMTYSTLAAAFPFWGDQAVGIGVGYLSYGSVPSFDSTGQPDASYSPHDLKMRLGYAKKINSFQAGLAATYVRSTIQESAVTETVDVGVQQSFNALILALSVENLGHALTYLNTPEPLPRRLRLGSSFRVTPAWCITSDLIDPTIGKTALAVGTEYALGLGENKEIAFRSGYKTGRSDGLSGVTGFSAGAGFRLGDTAVNYAWVPFGDLGQTHRLSVDFKMAAGSPNESASTNNDADLPLEERSVQESTRRAVREAAAQSVWPWKSSRPLNRSSKERLMDLLSQDALCPATGPKAVITRLGGSVRLRKADQLKWYRARIGQYLFESDVLKTGSASFADLILLNSVKLKMESDSLLGIRSAYPACELSRVRLEKGAIAADVDDDRGLAVETPVGEESLSGLKGTLVLSEKELVMRVTGSSASFNTEGRVFPLKEKLIFRKVSGRPGLITEDDSGTEIKVPVAPAESKKIVGRWDRAYVERILEAVKRLDFVPDLQTAEYARETGLRAALQADLVELEKNMADLKGRSATYGQDAGNFQKMIGALKIPPLTETPEEKKEREGNLRAAQKSFVQATSSFREIEKEFKVVQKEFRVDEEFLASVPIVRMLNVTAQQSVIPFSSAESALSAQMTSALDAISEVIRQLKPYRVIVEGHTDKVGSASVNRQLSKRRADAVVAYLRKNSALPPARFVAKGMGSSRPISKTDSPEELAKDRRVEIWLELRGL